MSGDTQTRQESIRDAALVLARQMESVFQGHSLPISTIESIIGSPMDEAFSAGRSAGLEEAAQIAQGLWNSGPCTCKECAEISTAILKRKEGD